MDQQEAQSVEPQTQVAKTKTTHKDSGVGAVLTTILILIFVAGVIAVIASLITNANKSKLQYSSINYQLNLTYVYFTIDSKETTNIFIEDFSIMVNGTPRNAEYFEDNNGKTLHVNTSTENFCVVFKFYEAQLDKPVRIFYKGEEINFNKPTKLYL